jgi:hypothetical protein
MSAFDKAERDLNSTMGASLQSGDASFAAGNYSAAVTAYQQAGQTGADQIGPEIDAAGFPNTTQYYTQQAWQVNSQLAAISATGANEGSALSASDLAQQMFQLYAQAIVAGKEIEPFWTPWTIGAAVVLGGAAVGIAAAVLKRKQPVRSSQAKTRRYSQMRTRRFSQAKTRAA